MREGKTTCFTREKLLARIEASKAKAVNIRLPEADLQLARDLARQGKVSRIRPTSSLPCMKLTARSSALESDYNSLLSFGWQHD